MKKRTGERRNQPRVDENGLPAKQVSERRKKELIEFFALHDPDYLMDKMRGIFDPDLELGPDPYNGRSRPD